MGPSVDLPLSSKLQVGRQDDQVRRDIGRDNRAEVIYREINAEVDVYTDMMIPQAGMLRTSHQRSFLWQRRRWTMSGFPKMTKKSLKRPVLQRCAVRYFLRLIWLLHALTTRA